MARFSVLTGVLTGVLLAVTALASPQSPVGEPSSECNIHNCMNMAIMGSWCGIGFFPSPATMSSETNAFTNCVCGNAELREKYFGCDGWCYVDQDTEPYCHGVDVAPADSASAVVDRDALAIAAAAHPEITAAAELSNLDARDEIAERDPKTWTISNWVNFCGVPGMFCMEKDVDKSSDAEADELEVAEASVPEITAAAKLEDLPEHAAIAERDPRTSYRNWINFCGVPGMFCMEKIAEETAVPVPTTLETVRDSLRLSI